VDLQRTDPYRPRLSLSHLGMILLSPGDQDERNLVNRYLDDVWNNLPQRGISTTVISDPGFTELQVSSSDPAKVAETLDRAEEDLRVMLNEVGKTLNIVAY
jgi:hypothetical protein